MVESWVPIDPYLPDEWSWNDVGQKLYRGSKEVWWKHRISESSAGAKEEQVRSVAGSIRWEGRHPCWPWVKRVKGSIRYERNSGHRIFIGLLLYLSHVGPLVDPYYLDQSYPLGDTVRFSGSRDNLQMLYKCYGIRFDAMKRRETLEGRWW